MLTFYHGAAIFSRASARVSRPASFVEVECRARLFGGLADRINVFNGLVNVMGSRRKLLWIIIGGAACLFVFVLLDVQFRQEGSPSSGISVPNRQASPIAINAGSSVEAGPSRVELEKTLDQFDAEAAALRSCNLRPLDYHNERAELRASHHR